MEAMATGLRTPPLGWVPLALVAMAHGLGGWAIMAPPAVMSSPPSGMRFALVVAPAQAAPARAAPAPAPVPLPQSRPEAERKPQPERKTTAAPVRKPAAVVASAASASERAAPAMTPAAPSAAPSTTASAAPPAPESPAPAAALPAGTEATQMAAIPATAPSFTADYLDNPKPDYPRISRRLGEEGVVVLIVSVGSDGRAGAMSVERSSGHDRLDAAARRGVREWRFVPARHNGVAVAAEVRVPITFSLQESR